MQTQQILEYLQQGNSITPLEALNHSGSWRQFEIARKFHCDQSNIHYILSGKTWKHVNA